MGQTISSRKRKRSFIFFAYIKYISLIRVSACISKVQRILFVCYYLTCDKEVDGLMSHVLRPCDPVWIDIHAYISHTTLLYITILQTTVIIISTDSSAVYEESISSLSSPSVAPRTLPHYLSCDSENRCLNNYSFKSKTLN